MYACAAYLLVTYHRRFLSLFPISMQKWEDKHLHHRKRHVSEDLPQGGLEIPCILSFEVASKEIREIKKLVAAALSNNPTQKTLMRHTDTRCHCAMCLLVLFSELKLVTDNLLSIYLYLLGSPCWPTTHIAWTS